MKTWQGYYNGERVTIEDSSTFHNITQHLIKNEDGEQMWVHEHDAKFEIVPAADLPISYFPLNYQRMESDT